MTFVVAVVLAVLGAGLIAAAVAVLAGAGWALLATGILSLVGAFLLYDPDVKRGSQ